jgi:hypothetical protein
MKPVYLVVGGVAVAGAGVGAYLLLRKPPPPPPAVQPGGGGSLCSRVATVAVQAGIAAGVSSAGAPGASAAVPPGVAPAGASLLCSAGSAVAKIALQGAKVVAHSVADVGSGIAGLFVDNYQSCPDRATAQGFTGAARDAEIARCERSREMSKLFAASTPTMGAGRTSAPTTTAVVGGVTVVRPSAPTFGRRR